MEQQELKLMLKLLITTIKDIKSANGMIETYKAMTQNEHTRLQIGKYEELESQSKKTQDMILDGLKEI